MILEYPKVNNIKTPFLHTDSSFFQRGVNFISPPYLRLVALSLRTVLDFFYQSLISDLPNCASNSKHSLYT